MANKNQVRREVRKIVKEIRNNIKNNIVVPTQPPATAKSKYAFYR